MTSPSNLYVNCRQLETWKVDGRALVIKQRARAPQLFPLVRLARVIFIGTLNGDVKYLLRLLECRIGVAFFHTNGGLTGAFYAPAQDSNLLPEISEKLAYDRVLRNWYAEWEENQARHLAGEIRRFQVTKPDVPKQQLRDAQAWLTGLAQVQLYQLGATYNLEQSSPCALRLLHGIDELLQPWLQMQSWRLLSRYPKADERRCVSYFQSIEDALEVHQRRLLVQLEVGASQWL